MSFDPFNIRDKARAIIIEQIMALEGRGHPHPRAFGDQLEHESLVQLSHRLELLTDFPLEETANEMHGRSQTPGANTPARFPATRRAPLVTQSELP